MGVDRLYYNTLGDQEKAAYDILVRGFQGRQSIVNVPHKRDSALEPLFRAIKYEHPELYYADLYATEVYRNALFEEYHLKYRYSEEETREKDRKIAAAVQSILRDTKGISEYKREKLIHDRIVRNVTYGKQEEAVYKAHSIEGVFLDRLAVCEGISMAFEYLCGKVGIPCAVIVGDLTIGPSYKNDEYDRHAWNLAEIEGHTYYLDVTNDNYRFGYLSYRFFNLSDQLISTTHRLPTDPLLPKCDYVYTPNPLVNNWDDLIKALKDGVRKKQPAVEMRISRRFLQISEVKDQFFEHLKDPSCQDVRRFIKSTFGEEKLHVFTVLFEYS